MRVFWKQGFDGTSYPDLMAATGMSKPTLYATFGDKVNLFREAVVAYSERSTAVYEAALDLPTAREVVETCLRLCCGFDSEPGEPVVCFLVQGAMTGSADTQELRDELVAVRRQAYEKMQARFERAKREGELSATADTAVMAELFAALSTGLSVQAASGTPPERLERVMQLTIAQWPFAS